MPTSTSPSIKTAGSPHASCGKAGPTKFRSLCCNLSTAKPQVCNKGYGPGLPPLPSTGYPPDQIQDDWLIMADSAQDLRSQTTWPLGLRQILGLIVNLEKSELKPARRRSTWGWIWTHQKLWPAPLGSGSFPNPSPRSFPDLGRTCGQALAPNTRSYGTARETGTSDKETYSSVQWCLRDACRQSTDSTFSPVTNIDTVARTSESLGR